MFRAQKALKISYCFYRVRQMLELACTPVPFAALCLEAEMPVCRETA